MTSPSQGLHSEGIWTREQCLDESHQFWDNLGKKSYNCLSYFLKGVGGGWTREINFNNKCFKGKYPMGLDRMSIRYSADQVPR